MPAPDLNTWRTRRAVRNWALAVVLMAALAALSWADHSGLFLYDGGDRRHYQNSSFIVTKVIDGDTIEIATPDGDKPTTHVRLWGVNSPEIAHPRYNKKPGQPFGPEATEFTRSLCEGKTVRLELQQHRVRDGFGRVLAYVKLPDGVILNEQLLVAGLARADNRPGDERFTHQWSGRYALIERQARIDRAGIWSASEGTTAPDGNGVDQADSQ